MPKGPRPGAAVWVTPCRGPLAQSGKLRGGRGQSPRLIGEVDHKSVAG